MAYSLLYTTANKETLHKVRLQLVHHAKAYGIRSAARTYKASRTTIRLWVRRYTESPKATLYNRQSTSKQHPHTMLLYYTCKLQDICKTLTRYHQRLIVSHIKQEYTIPYSIKTIIKHLRSMNLFPEKKRAHNKAPKMLAYGNNHFAFVRTYKSI